MSIGLINLCIFRCYIYIGDQIMSSYPKSIIYSQNTGILTPKQQVDIHNSNIMIIGLGGLGGALTNNLVRLGVEHITLVDFDVYSPSNLNRQLFSSLNTIGLFKVDVVCEELQHINQDLKMHLIQKQIEELNNDEFESIDYLIDCTDNPQTKLHIIALGKQFNIPVLHGACAGWYGQVGWIMPGCSLLNELYLERDHGLEAEMLNSAFTPAFTASYMTAEFVKMVTNNNPSINEILFIDILNNKISPLGKGE